MYILSFLQHWKYPIYKSFVYSHYLKAPTVFICFSLSTGYLAAATSLLPCLVALLLPNFHFTDSSFTASADSAIRVCHISACCLFFHLLCRIFWHILEVSFVVYHIRDDLVNGIWINAKSILLCYYRGVLSSSFFSRSFDGSYNDIQLSLKFLDFSKIYQRTRLLSSLQAVIIKSKIIRFLKKNSKYFLNTFFPDTFLCR